MLRVTACACITSPTFLHSHLTAGTFSCFYPHSLPRGAMCEETVKRRKLAKAVACKEVKTGTGNFVREDCRK